MTNSSPQRQAQDTSPNIVTNLASRDRWMIAFNEAAGSLDINAVTVALANRVALHFNCKSHRCDPGYDTLAREMGTSRRTVMRAISAIEAAGYMERRRGGRDDKVSFTLSIPNAANHVPAHDQETKNDDRIGDTMLSPMEATPYVTNSVSIGDTQAVTTKEQRNREVSSAAPPRASSPVDRVEPVTPVDRERAFGALLNAYPKYPRDPSDTQCRGIFEQLLDDGTDPDKIINGATAYAERCEGTKINPREIRLLIFYLRVKGWLPDNRKMQPPPYTAPPASRSSPLASMIGVTAGSSNHHMSAPF